MSLSENETTLERLTRLTQGISKEREAERDYFKEKVMRRSLKERVQQGWTWFPVSVTKSGYHLGERRFIMLERDANNKSPHVFKPGNGVIIHSYDHDGSISDSQGGIIQFVDRHRMKIILSGNALPEDSKYSKLSVDFALDERSYDEMASTLQSVIKKKNKNAGYWLDIFDKPANRPEDFDRPAETDAGLNESQLQGVEIALNAGAVGIIHGPPGTGKTTTMVAAIQQLCGYGEQVFACAASNSAADYLALRTAEKGLNVVRVGNLARIDEGILELTIESKVSRHPNYRQVKKVRTELNVRKEKALRVLRNDRKGNKGDAGAEMREVRMMESYTRDLEDRIVHQVLFHADVIVTTLVSASNTVLSKMEFTTLMVDEAAQALEPALWIPLLKSKRLIMSGDPFQLPPVVKSKEAEKLGLSITLMERLLPLEASVVMLNTQYRMHRDIMQFSADYFYQGKLKAAETVANQQLKVGGELALEYIDTAGCGFEEVLNEETLSRFNPGEFDILREHMIQMLTETHFNPSFQIGIISPYKEQVIYIGDTLKTDSELVPVRNKLRIDSIDGFQGRECDWIYISLVRSNDHGEIGFLKDYRRMNVALTRAKYKLVVIGDSATIGQDPFYASFLSYVDEIGAYRSAWEFMR